MHDYLRVKTPTFYHSVPFNFPSSKKKRVDIAFFLKPYVIITLFRISIVLN